MNDELSKNQADCHTERRPFVGIGLVAVNQDCNNGVAKMPQPAMMYCRFLDIDNATVACCVRRSSQEPHGLQARPT